MVLLAGLVLLQAAFSAYLSSVIRRSGKIRKNAWLAIALPIPLVTLLFLSPIYVMGADLQVSEWLFFLGLWLTGAAAALVAYPRQQVDKL